MQEISEAMATTTADSSTNTSETLSLENGNSLPGDSFSSESNEAEDTFVLQLQDLSRHLNSFPSVPKERLLLGRKKTAYREVEVFSAEKYFNEGVEQRTRKVVENCGPSFQGNKDDAPETSFQGNKHDTPGASFLGNEDDIPETGSLTIKTRAGMRSMPSDLSWNSLSSLLRLSRNQQSRKVNNSRTWSFLASLGCNCSCKDKESVKVDNSTNGAKAKEPLKNGNISQSKKSNSNAQRKEDRNYNRVDEPRRELNTSNHTSFPVLNSKTRMGNNLDLQEEEGGGLRRKSLEVFGSPIRSIGVKPLSLEKQRLMLSWDAIIPQREVESEILGSSNYKCNETDSDASSDLFEIESFSTNANRDGISASCVTPTTCDATGASNK